MAEGRAPAFVWPAARYDAMREIRARVKELAELVTRISSLRLPGRSLQDDLKVITEVGPTAAGGSLQA